jgi:hypothetical protein
VSAPELKTNQAALEAEPALAHVPLRTTGGMRMAASQLALGLPVLLLF